MNYKHELHVIIQMFVDEAGYTIEKMSMNGVLSEDNERFADKLDKAWQA